MSILNVVFFYRKCIWRNRCDRSYIMSKISNCITNCQVLKMSLSRRRKKNVLRFLCSPKSTNSESEHWKLSFLLYWIFIEWNICIFNLKVFVVRTFFSSSQWSQLLALSKLLQPHFFFANFFRLKIWHNLHVRACFDMNSSVFTRFYRLKLVKSSKKKSDIIHRTHVSISLWTWAKFVEH